MLTLGNQRIIKTDSAAKKEPRPLWLLQSISSSNPNKSMIKKEKTRITEQEYLSLFLWPEQLLIRIIGFFMPNPPEPVFKWEVRRAGNLTVAQGYECPRCRLVVGDEDKVKNHRCYPLL